VTLTPRLIAELDAIARDSLPQEACGLLLTPWSGPQVIALPNRSDSPTDRYETSADDLPEDLIAAWVDEIDWTPDEQLPLTIWHTHPAGSIGPSSVDLEQRNSEAAHLVLSILPDRLVPTWY
jgi:proteasome lid subunit RPN8/RPN11